MPACLRACLHAVVGQQRPALFQAGHKRRVGSRHLLASFQMSGGANENGIAQEVPRRVRQARVVQQRGQEEHGSLLGLAGALSLVDVCEAHAVVPAHLLDGGSIPCRINRRSRCTATGSARPKGRVVRLANMVVASARKRTEPPPLLRRSPSERRSSSPADPGASRADAKSAVREEEAAFLARLRDEETPAAALNSPHLEVRGGLGPQGQTLQRAAC
mmetsp:Transcript_126886/g.406306  ORF Transcript_126886/g.406306 Transcript_126886/m.406306 type:complete len:217 (+) Transcript_126886:868-1518(+)